MKKLSLYIATVILTAGLASCSNDEWKDEVDSLKQPLPVGIVQLSAPTEMVKGDTVTITFRVNPSDAPLTLESLLLDCLHNEVYELETKDKTTETRVSYVAAPAHYKLTALELATNEKNEALDGQYIASVTATADANIFDVSSLCLVIKGTDLQGKERLVSSEPFEITMVPTIEEGVSVWHAKNHSYHKINSDSVILPSYISADEHTYALKGTDRVKVYSLEKYLASASYIPETVSDVNPEEKPGGLFVVRDSLRQKGFIELAPVADAKWDALDDKLNAKLETNGSIELTDIFGTKCVYNAPINYFNNTVMPIPLNIPITDVNIKAEYAVNISKLLEQAGWNSQEIATYPRQLITTANRSEDENEFDCQYNEENENIELDFWGDGLGKQKTYLYFTLNVTPTSKGSPLETTKYICLNFVIHINPYLEKNE